jgi:hypothetical protein
MTAKELERQIEDMRIQFAKENWNGDVADNMSRRDWLNVYLLLFTKEKVDK